MKCDFDFKTLFFFILILLVFPEKPDCYANTPEYADSLLVRSHYQNQKLGNAEKAIELAFEAKELSEKIGYSKGIVKGLYNIAVLLSDGGNFEKSIEYIEKAKSYRKILRTNKDLHFNLLLLQCSNSYELGLYALASSYYHEAYATILEEEHAGRRKHYLMILFINSDMAYEDIDSQYVYYIKAKDISDEPDSWSENFSKVEFLAKRAQLYEKLGTVYKDKGHVDSARYYYNVSLEVSEELDSALPQAIALARLGELLEYEGKYDEALDYLTNAEDLFKSSSNPGNLSIVYNMKRQVYSKMQNPEKEMEYLRLNNQLMDSLNRAKNKGRDQAVLNLVHEKENELETIRYRYIISLMIIVIIFSAYLLYRQIDFSRYRKRKKQLLLQKENEIKQKEQVLRESIDIITEKTLKEQELRQQIRQKEQEAIELKTRINDSFSEIIDLAKSNDPHFWPRFHEVYPYFAENLLSINPRLRTSELTSLAYIYLGFTTKEIAEYTFKAVKTIESNRYNLRKRLGLSPEIDLHNYLNSMSH